MDGTLTWLARYSRRCLSNNGHFHKEEKKLDNVPNKVQKWDRNPAKGTKGLVSKETPKGNFWQSRLRK